MITRNVLASARMLAVALLVSLFVAACGGSGSSTEPEVTQATPPATGTVSLLFTDLPTDAYDSIWLFVSEAILIGDDDSQQVLFSADPPREIDLLDLTNYSEPVWFGEVAAGTYTKIRLRLDDIKLLPAGATPGTEESIGKLQANGKVDLLHPDGFDVLPGRNLTIEIDVDANKSIKITDAGNSGKVNFRPVVRVNIYDTGLPAKLARLEGYIAGEPNATDGTFVLCRFDTSDNCVDVATDVETSFFNEVGEQSAGGFGDLADGDMVVVIGEYGTDPFVLNAVVVENFDTAEQISGIVATEPADSQFLVLTVDEQDYIVELQPNTKFYNASGPITVDFVALGDRVEVEGVIPAEADPDVIRAALVFLEANMAEQLSGTIAAGTLDTDARSFDLTTALESVCVRVAAEASILLVDTTGSTVMPGGFGDLADDQVVDLFGATAADACFDADEVIVDVTPSE